MKALFGFKNGPLAMIIFVMFAAVSLLVLIPHGGVEKLGFTLAMGLGVGYLTNAMKAMQAQAYRISVWMVVMGLTLILAGIFFTPESTFTGTVLDDFGALILGAMLGLTAKVEEA